METRPHRRLDSVRGVRNGGADGIPHRAVDRRDRADPHRKEALARYGVNGMVVNSFEHNSGALYAIVPAMTQAGESDWKLVYEAPQALVFLRDPAPDIPILDKSRIVLDHLEAECRLH